MQEEMARITIILIDTHKKEKTQWQCVKLLPSEKKNTATRNKKQPDALLFVVNQHQRGAVGAAGSA